VTQAVKGDASNVRSLDDLRELHLTESAAPQRQSERVLVVAKLAPLASEDQAKVTIAAPVLHLQLCLRAFVIPQRTETAARDAACQRAVDSFRSDEGKAVAALRTGLRAVCKANAVLRDIQQRKHEITGQPFEALSWFELTDDPSGRLAQWEARVREYGFGE
jgi:hypothetical protein